MPTLLVSFSFRGKRWERLNVMTGAGAMSIREAARRVERDVKAVHGDVTALLNAGLLSKTDDGMIVFLYDAIHVDFMLKAGCERRLHLHVTYASSSIDHIAGFQNSYRRPAVAA